MSLFLRAVGGVTLGRAAGQAALAQGDPLPPDDRLVAPSLNLVEVLYREQRPGLLRFLRGKGASDHAGDFVQQVFARLAGLGRDRQADIAHPAAYLRRSAANVAADHAKSELRHSIAFHVSSDEVDLRAPDQIATLEARDMLRRLELAIQRLKPRTREIFLAHRLDGYSYVEIATITGLSVKGVEKHMSRAIAHVDRVLADR